jgi:hypothetical protein
LISPLENLYTEELYKTPFRVIVVISRPWAEVSEEDRAVLSKMLVAVKLSLASVQIINMKEFGLNDLGAFSPSKVLAFGASIRSDAKMYEHFTLDGVSVIMAESLEKLDDAKKKSLWLALKQMFGI